MTQVKAKHGGARPGAGRKKTEPVLMPALPSGTPAPNGEPDSLRLMRAMVNDAGLDARIRLDAARSLAPYEAMRKGEGGKKEGAKDAAKRAGSGKFSPSKPPLSVVK